MRVSSRAPSADDIEMNKAYENYGMCAAALIGGSFMAKNFWRAYNLGKYVEYKAMPGCQEQAQLAADLAEVPPSQLKRARTTILALRLRGIH